MVVLIAVLAVTSVIGLIWSRRQGRLRKVVGGDSLLPLLATLGEQAGDRATLLQFSSSVCAPCRAARQLLSAVAASEPGVRHVEVDAEGHLDVVRQLNILKTPTILVLDPRGHVVLRAAGLPRREDIHAALGRAVG
ncbi:MAG: hypothetical protein NVSMB55_28280 [Mycobacteriales bacterium]